MEEVIKMPRWCMNCGNVNFPDMADSVKMTKKGPKWKSFSKAALKRKKIVVCGACWRRILLGGLKTQKPSSVPGGVWFFPKSAFARQLLTFPVTLLSGITLQ